VQERLEPLLRVRRFLESAGVWSEPADRELRLECEREIEIAVEAYLATPPQAPESIFDHLYASLPEPMLEQRSALLRECAALGETSDA
jgi:pyruvate dehydrogenase E1 component alpha subunit